MTTIAWDGKSLAADRLVVQGGAIVLYRPKLVKAGTRGWFAVTGDLADSQALLDYFDGGDRPTFSASAALCWIDGELFEFDEATIPIRYEKPDRVRLAIGSGAKWALAAMDFGADARDAVRYAAKRDTCTGGRIDVVHIF